MASAATSNEELLPLRLATSQAGGGQPSGEGSVQHVGKLNENVENYISKAWNSYGAVHKIAAIQEESLAPNDKIFSDRDAFVNYMRSSASSATAPPRKHDLSRPLSNYYISTSHNTYLSGNQLYGEATTAAYTNVLVRGCRCLEIDVWDGEGPSARDPDVEDEDGPGAKKHHRWDKLKLHAQAPRGQPKERPLHTNNEGESVSAGRRAEPRVLHGYTLTREISFHSVCHAIRDSAFVTTDLPLIVSLEVHAGLEQQERMVEIMEESWKGVLVDVDEKQRQDIEHLPSPDQLRNKILIKVKWTPNPKTGESNNPLDHVDSNSSDEEHQTPAGTTQQKKKAKKILESLSHLGVYTRAYSFKTFDQEEAKIPTHVFSLSEQKILDMHEEHGSALFNHNRNYMMRVFPSGLRVNSSNVEPTFLWRQGAQMVALNWQKWDAGMMLNEGMFAGEDGWVLKPPGYQSTTGPSSTTASTPIHPRTLDLTVELLAGQSIPLPHEKESSYLHKFHPYVKMQLHVDDGPASNSTSNKAAAEEKKESAKQFKRRSRTAKGTDPDLEGETMRWSSVGNVIEELSFLRLKIQDDRKMGKDDLAAWACIRLDRLQSGYRFIHLLDSKGLQSSGVLLVRITKHFS